MSVRELTATAPGAVRILELTGERERVRLQELFSRPLPVRGQLALGRLVEGGGTLDEVLVVARDDGALEVHLHGSMAVVTRVAESLASMPGAPASRRARLERWLAEARTETAARVLLDQWEGALEFALAHLCSTPDDDAALDELIAAARFGPDLVEPRRVVLVGPTNAGKSTLFNALLGAERVLTSATAGTTRDSVAEPWDAGGFPIVLFDTAGWRAVVGTSGAEEIERAGQQRGRALVATADLVVWATAEPGPAPAVEAPRVAVLGLQADRVTHPAERPALSALADPGAAAQAFAELVRGAFGWPSEVWVRGRQRAIPVESGELARLVEARAARGAARAALLAGIADESHVPG